MMMKFLKRLAFKLVKDDLGCVLKIHDERILAALVSHYGKAVADIDALLEARKEELVSILQTELETRVLAMEVSTEEKLSEVKSELKRDISNSMPNARDVASELDYENLSASIDYSLLNYGELAKLVVAEPLFKVELEKTDIKPLVQKIGKALIHYDDSRINSVRDALNILI
jgi:hypothetical protein